MADKEKKVAQNSDVEKATTDESKAAAKVAKAAKGNANKKDKPNFFVRASKGTKHFFKDFKGECKKIVWPDAKTVLKSTGIVLLVVSIVCIIVYGIDQGLTAGIEGLKNLAAPETTAAVAEGEGEAEAEEQDHDHENEEETAESEEDSSKEETTEEEATEAEEKEEETSASEQAE